MSTMEEFFILDSENKVVADTPNVEKAMDSFRNVARKRLADITNLPQQSSKYIDRLKKENVVLMQLLADRDKINEPSGSELYKLRLQNMQLAQANSEILAELNSCKDRLKVLQHELGCKNALLKSISQEKEKTTTHQKDDIEVEVTKREESSKADSDNSKPCLTKRRQRLKCLGPSTVKVQDKKAKNKRNQSAGFRSEEPRPAEDLFDIDDARHPVCPLVDDQIHKDGPTSMFLPVNKEGDSSPCHQAREFGSLPIGRPLREAGTKVQSYKEIPLDMKMRRPDIRVRRQSALFRSEEPRPAEYMFEIDNAELPVCPLVDDQMHEDGSTSMCLSAHKDTQEFGRRPLRQAATKVQSYKEIPLNMKMRRPE